MIDVVFVTPTAYTNVIQESIGTVLLATILKQKGIESHVLCFARFGEKDNYPAFFEEAIRQICEENPKILSFYTRSDCFHIMLKMAQVVKERIGCTVVFGGPQSDIVARETMEEIPYVDFICCGEGENTVYPLFSSILRGEPDLSVDGLVYRKDGQVYMNPRPALIEDLDTLPLLDYTVFPEGYICEPTTAFPIDVGRGCPFGCTFCSTKTFWGRKYRLKSPKRIAQELQYYYDTFGVRHFSFQHDMFTMNKELVKETCRLIKELPFKCTWNCSARLDCIDRDLIDTMVEGGMYNIYLGIETASPRMQKIVNKNLKLDHAMEEIEYLLSKNVIVATSFICGFPQETEEDMSHTFAMAMALYRYKRVRVQMHRCSFLPGTALFEEYKDRLVTTDVMCDMTGSFGVKENQDLIAAHPRLFQYFNEYNTELRNKLIHIHLFLDYMRITRPVYLHFADKYPKETKIQMYFDFAELNREVLDDPLLTNEQKIDALLKKDRFAEKFAGGPCDAMIADIYGLYRAKRSVSNGTVPQAMVFSCVSPKELDEGVPLECCKAGCYMATYFRDETGTTKVKIKHL